MSLDNMPTSEETKTEKDLEQQVINTNLKSNASPCQGGFPHIGGTSRPCVKYGCNCKNVYSCQELKNYQRGK